jgi:hypothetical protein
VIVNATDFPKMRIRNYLSNHFVNFPMFIVLTVRYFDPFPGNRIKRRYVYCHHSRYVSRVRARVHYGEEQEGGREVGHSSFDSGSCLF